MKGFFKKGLEDEDDSSEIHELRQSVLDKKMPEPVEKTVLKEIDRLFKIHPSSAEYTIGINYIDYLTTLPWNQYTEDNLDINHAESILDRAHYGLDEIKERILEHLAVRIMKLSAKKTILVVDDEKMTRMNLSHVLGKDGYEVEIAESGTKALEKMEETTFDLVITDLKMDKVDGLMLLDSIKKNFSIEMLYSPNVF